MRKWILNAQARDQTVSMNFLVILKDLHFKILLGLLQSMLFCKLKCKLQVVLAIMGSLLRVLKARKKNILQSCVRLNIC